MLVKNHNMNSVSVENVAGILCRRRALAERDDSPEIRSFVNLLTSDRLGRPRNTDPVTSSLLGHHQGHPGESGGPPSLLQHPLRRLPPYPSPRIPPPYGRRKQTNEWCGQVNITY